MLRALGPEAGPVAEQREARPAQWAVRLEAQWGPRAALAAERPG